MLRFLTQSRHLVVNQKLLSKVTILYRHFNRKYFIFPHTNIGETKKNVFLNLVGFLPTYTFITFETLCITIFNNGWIDVCCWKFSLALTTKQQSLS